MPLYAFVGDMPLWAQLRSGASDAAAGGVPALEKSSGGAANKRASSCGDYYDVNGGTIRVWAVLDCRQHPASIRRRLAGLRQ